VSGRRNRCRRRQQRIESSSNRVEEVGGGGTTAQGNGADMEGENQQDGRYSSAAASAGNEQVGSVGREWNDDAGGEWGGGEQVDGGYGSGNVSDPAPVHVRYYGGGGRGTDRPDGRVEAQDHQVGGEVENRLDLFFPTDPVSVEPAVRVIPMYSFSSPADDYDYGPPSPTASPENCTACMDVEREREERERRYRMEREYSDVANFFNSQYSRYSQPSGFAQTRLYRHCFVCNRNHL
jgi:hypothetical protein